jgi:hypothetical protein
MYVWFTKTFQLKILVLLLKPSHPLHIQPQSIQSTRLSCQSSELGPPPTHLQGSVAPPSFGSRGGHIRLRGRGGGPIPTKGQRLWCSVYTIILPRMEQISIKTPNPKRHLCWCLTEFIDWRYSQSQSVMWVFSTTLVN